MSLPSAKKLLLVGASARDPDAKAYIARMTARPTPQRVRVIDRLFARLKAAGIYDALDALYLFAAHHEQAARLNLISSSFEVQIGRFGSGIEPVFVADRYYGARASEDGTDRSCFFETGIAASTAGKKLTQTNASLSGIARLTLTDAPTEGGRWGGQSIATGPSASLLARSSTAEFGLFSSGPAASSAVVVPTTSFLSASRLSGRHYGTVEGSQVLNAANTSTVNSQSFRFGANGARGNNINMMAGAIGAFLTVEQTENLRLALNEYLVAVGARSA